MPHYSTSPARRPERCGFHVLAERARSVFLERFRRKVSQHDRDGCFSESRLSCLCGRQREYPPPSWSAVSNVLPTTRMNTGLLWAPYWRRRVSSRRLLTSLGIPQTQRHLASLGFMSPSEVANFQFENLLPRARKKWAGNCVHAALAGVFLACMLSSVRLNHRN